MLMSMYGSDAEYAPGNFTVGDPVADPPPVTMSCPHLLRGKRVVFIRGQRDLTGRWG